jgi:hypothetical protein
MGAIEPESLDTMSRLLEAYYHEGSKDFYVKTTSGRYVRMRESSVRRELRRVGINKEDGERGDALDPQETFITECIHHRDIVFAGSMAGYKQGFYEDCGSRFLVTTDPVLPVAVHGDWSVLKQFIEGMLEDQSIWFYAWIKLAYETILAGKRRHGQALVLAGPKECGKSLLQNIITKILGGRSAKPYQAMNGSTPFNADLFSAEHLMLEDEMPAHDLKSRRSLGASIKSFTANEEQRCHAKGQTPFMARPFWRVTVSVNDEPENLMVLPPLDESLEDKMIILRAFKKKMPMPTTDLAERDAYWATLMEQVPHMLYDLTHWTIPEHMRSPRYGVTHYHNPDIVGMVNELSPEMKLIQLIDKEYAYNFPVTATSVEIEQKLKDADSSVKDEARSLLNYNTSCGQYLSRLVTKLPDRVTSQIKHGGKRVFTIYREPAEVEANQKIVDALLAEQVN